MDLRADGWPVRDRSIGSAATTIWGRDPGRWRSWISNQGPVLVRVAVDRTWDRAAAVNAFDEAYGAVL